MSRGFAPKSQSSSTPRPLLKEQLNLEHPFLPTPNLNKVMSILTRYRKREG